MIPTDEDQRLQLIQDLNILQHFQNDETFERMTFLASEFLKCPMALITIVGEKSLWFLTNVGLESLHEGIRKISFCQHVIMPDAPECFVIPDASKDSRFHENPLVTGSLHIRFYAASPIYLQDVKVGTFCLLDTVPRDDFDIEKEKRLIELARNVSDMMLEKKLEFVNCGNSQMTLDILQNLTGEIVGTLKNMIGLQEELRHTHRAVQTITNNNNNSKKKKSTPASTPTNAEVTASSSSKSVEVEEMELLTTLEMKKQELFEQRLFIQSMLQKGLTSLNNLQKNNAHNKSHHELSSMMVKPSPRNATTATKSESVFLPPHHAFVRGQYIALPQWFNKLKQLTINQLPHYHLIAKHVKWDLKMSTCSTNSSNNDVQSISPPTSRRSSIKSTTRSMTQSSDLDDPQLLPSQVMNTTSSKKETRKVYRACTGEAAQNHSFHLLYGKLAVEVKAHGKITHTTQKNNNSSLISPAGLSLSSSKSKPPTPLSNSSSSLSASLLPASDAYPLFPEENQFFSICDNFIANSFQIMQGEYQKYYNRNEEMTNFWVACFMKENILSTSSSTPTASASATSFSPRNAALFFGGSSKKREQPPAKLLSLKEDEEKNDNNEKNIININSNNNSDKEKNKKLTGFISNQVSKVGSFFNSSINRFLMNDWMNRTSSTHTVPSTVPALSDVIEPVAVVKKSPTLRPEPLSIGSGSQSNESDESEPQSKEDATFSEHVKATQRTKETMVEEFSLSYQESIMENEAVEDKRKSLKKSKSPSSNSPISSVHSTPRHSGRFFFPSTSSKVHVSND